MILSPKCIRLLEFLTAVESDIDFKLNWRFKRNIITSPPVRKERRTDTIFNMCVKAYVLRMCMWCIIYVQPSYNMLTHFAGHIGVIVKSRFPLTAGRKRTVRRICCTEKLI